MARKQVRTLVLRVWVTSASIAIGIAGYCSEAKADVDTVRALRKAGKAVHLIERRASTSTVNIASDDHAVTPKGGPNFTGLWAGRYVKLREFCPTNVGSFLFRHALLQSGGAASLRTTHDGDFLGRSRDRGRRLEFVKQIFGQNGVRCGVAVVYKDLSRNKRVSATGYAVSCNNGCGGTFGANAIRQ